MSASKDSIFELIEQIKKKAPEYLDLLTAKTDEEFETAFDAVLDKAVRHLEKNSKNFKKLNEVGLSGALAGSLSIPGLTVTQEAHSNGHVDLIIEADHCIPNRTKLAEAKIYGGPEYHISGMSQLLDRYSTGSEGRGLLISFVRQQDIKSLIANLRKKMDKELPLQQTKPTQNHKLKWSFLSMHTHSSGEELELGHVGCNLFSNKTKK